MSEGKGTLGHDSGRHHLRFQRLLAHPPKRVWRALTDGDELATWFPARMEGSRESGAPLRFILPPKPGQVPADTTEEGLTMTGNMLVFDPPELLEYLWDADVLRWELESHGDGTLLTFTHTFDDPRRAARDSAGWDICLASLVSVLSGTPAQPFTAERHEALFDHYAKRFGPEAAVLRSPDM